MKILAPAAALLLAALLASCGGGGIDRPSIDEIGSESVSYQTADGVTISASFFPPAQFTSRVVILLHEEGGTRAQWNDLTGVLVDNEYAVLAPDLRGHGQSGGPGEPTVDMLGDVAAALEFLRTRTDIDLNYVGIIGARVGADLAYVATGLHLEVDVAVAMTPHPFVPPGDPLLASIPDFAAHDVFIMAGGKTQWEDAVSLGVKTQNPGGRRYIDHSDLEGVALLTVDEPVKDILDWLKTRYEDPTQEVPPAPTPVPATAS